jgi:16S rRNA (guanine966-N2)-methyltransferase
MRVVGGTFSGRPLAGPKHDGLRPTSDRVRESIFNILAHGAAHIDLDGIRVLDLFAGTGALGIEALSRGAAFCLFVEDDADARGLIRRNIEDLGLTGVTKIFRRDARDLGPAANRSTSGLVFLDPPYDKGFAIPALHSAAAGGWLAPGAMIVIEDRKGANVPLPSGFDKIDRRTWGDTEVTFARFRGAEPAT